MTWGLKTPVARAAAVLLAAVAVFVPAGGRAAGGTYRLVENWAQLPPGTQWGVMTAVGVDAHDNVYAFQQGELNTPHNIAMDSKGRVWVCDRGNKRLQVFDQNGRYLDQMAQFGAPAAIVITKDDVMFVKQ